MMNPYDFDSMNTIASGRREQFLEEVRRDRIYRELGAGRQRVPGRFRRAIGLRLIQAGSRLSGINNDIRHAGSSA